MNDLIRFQRMALGTVLAPISINATAATNLYVDTQGFKSAYVIFGLGVTGAADYDAITIIASDTTSGGTAITGGAFTVTGTATDDGETKVGIVDLTKVGKRYISVSIDPGAVDCLACCYVLLGDPVEGANSLTEAGAPSPATRYVTERLICA